MKYPMLVKSVTRAWRPWKDSIVVEAQDYAEATFGTMIGGDKVYYIRKGRKVRLSVPRSWCCEAGEHYTLSCLVMQSEGSFNWDWASSMM